MAYYDPKKTAASESIRPFFKFLMVIVLVSLLIWAWYESNWFYHDRMSTVQAKGWQAGEYKFCVTVTRQELKYPLLVDCDQSLEHDPKFFNVRFWGPIQKHEEEAGTMMHWKCRKNTEGEPAITCESEAR